MKLHQTFMKGRNLLKIEGFILEGRRRGEVSGTSSVCGSPYLSENEVPYLVVDKSALGEVDETIAMVIGVPIIQKCQVGHVEAPEQSTSIAPHIITHHTITSHTTSHHTHHTHITPHITPHQTSSTQPGGI